MSIGVDKPGNDSDLFTGEDAIEFLFNTVGWDKASLFATEHHALITGSRHSAPDHCRDKKTQSPRYRRVDLIYWASVH